MKNIHENSGHLVSLLPVILLLEFVTWKGVAVVVRDLVHEQEEIINRIPVGHDDENIEVWIVYGTIRK